MLREIILLFFILLLLTSGAYAGELNLGPLYHPVRNSSYDREFNALGPFIIYRKSSDYSEYGFRPLYHKTLKKRGTLKSLSLSIP